MILFRLNLLMVVIVLCSLVVYTRSLSAQDREDSSTLDTITVEAPRPDWESKLSPGTVTIVRPDEQKGEHKNLADLLKEVAGVYVREVTGRGHYTTVSIRGSTSAQVGIFIDGVLSNLGGDAAVDVSTIPVKNIERIEVYRGYIPVRFGGTFIGGVVNIVTKKPEKTDIQVSIGKSSFGGYQGTFQLERMLAGGGLLVAFNYDSSRGDFQYDNREAQRRTKIYQYRLDEFMYKIGNESGAPWTMITSDTAGTICGDSTAAAFVPAICNAYSTIISSTDPTQRINFALDLWEAMDTPEMYSVAAYFATAWGGDADYWLDQLKDASALTQYNAFVDNVNFWSQTQKRIRQNNAYENNDILIKWQNDNFFFKFAWKSIERYVPNALNIIGYGPYEFADGPFIVPFNLSRKQNIISRSFTAGYRNQISNLEWGISANYNEESKAYAFQNISQLQLSQTLTSWSAALKIWSRYESKRFGFQLDGEYKLGNRNLLEFLVNYSHEKLEIYGNGMRDEMKFVPDNVTYRPEFQQTLFNVQLQDTITLDNNESFFLTASVKYNLSRIFGARPLEHSHVSSTNQDIYQTNSKYTWQVALKKTFGDTFALRATYGTYYRLLNLYEIAGDGVGILPQTSTDTGTRGQQLFPEPEEGKQWDISAMFHTRWFNSDTNITLTYYGRSSKKILHLFKMAYNYMSYSNAISGKVTGLELEASIAWEKFDILMSGTLQNTRMKRRDMNWGSDRLTYPVNLPYTPEKQAYVRMNIRPIKELSLFAELNYTGEMPTSYNQDNHDFLEKITTVGFGAKATLPYGFELVVGVRDFFNKEPKQRVFSKTYYTADPIAFADFNADYPGQGRTIYVTLTYSY